jgi:hypothetical protein
MKRFFLRERFGRKESTHDEVSSFQQDFVVYVPFPQNRTVGRRTKKANRRSYQSKNEKILKKTDSKSESVN